ncbi:AraC family transcriptional regulator [Flammeovirga sp. OC4]|uniref:helix-turn-helix domain-containing protein n=1 Tax=Flammeovirga sp. OC4 TaxID=1382345 RepID=UPI0005C5F065|nr:helix-turn-helix domain-containing protein [Flammeovirga sp. OC4]
MEIKRFKEINTFFETTGFEKRTDIPAFFVFRFEELNIDTALKMPPYQKDFYQVALMINGENASASIDVQSTDKLGNTLYFLSPDHIFSWQRNSKMTGFNVFFKAEFLDFFSGNFKSEFSLFDLSNKNFIKLDSKELQNILIDFEKLYKEYNTPNSYRHQILQSSLLSLLFKCKSIDEEKGSTKNLSKKEETINRFRNLVTNSFIKNKKVSDYADLLNVSSNYLNQTVKSVTGKTAKEVISNQIIQEAKRYLKYSTDDISEISYALGYEEPTHFIRFFKNQTQITPNEYRKNLM